MRLHENYSFNFFLILALHILPYDGRRTEEMHEEHRVCDETDNYYKSEATFLLDKSLAL
jgi:hypothetical protein